MHIAAALGQVDPAYELFAEGFTHKPGQDYVSFATMVQRRCIAILQSAAVAIGVPALFAEKKLHAFRVQCTNVLGSTGAEAESRGRKWVSLLGVVVTLGRWVKLSALVRQHMASSKAVGCHNIAVVRKLASRAQHDLVVRIEHRSSRDGEHFPALDEAHSGSGASGNAQRVTC